MLAAVVPVRNEENRIAKALDTLFATPVDLIIPVLNGNTDQSVDYVRQLKSPRIFPLFFAEALGIDVPRAVGAQVAYNKGAGTILFLDGDMEGNIAVNLCELLDDVHLNHFDMSLTNCYPDSTQNNISALAMHLLETRRHLNQKIGLEKKIGAATPSHGPHAISRRFLERVPLKELAIPPVSLALAAKNNLQVNIGTSIGHKYLGSSEKNGKHSSLIAETIIGDCIEAYCVFSDKNRHRVKNGVPHNGYHLRRRWDILESFINESVGQTSPSADRYFEQK